MRGHLQTVLLRSEFVHWSGFLSINDAVSHFTHWESSGTTGGRQPDVRILAFRSVIWGSLLFITPLSSKYIATLVELLGLIWLYLMEVGNLNVCRVYFFQEFLSLKWCILATGFKFG